jgi:hypothetical protein
MVNARGLTTSRYFSCSFGRFSSPCRFRIAMPGRTFQSAGFDVELRVGLGRLDLADHTFQNIVHAILLGLG